MKFTEERKKLHNFSITTGVFIIINLINFLILFLNEDFGATDFLKEPRVIIVYIVLPVIIGIALIALGGAGNYAKKNTADTAFTFTLALAVSFGLMVFFEFFFLFLKLWLEVSEIDDNANSSDMKDLYIVLAHLFISSLLSVLIIIFGILAIKKQNADFNDYRAGNKSVSVSALLSGAFSIGLNVYLIISVVKNLGKYYERKSSLNYSLSDYQQKVEDVSLFSIYFFLAVVIVLACFGLYAVVIGAKDINSNKSFIGNAKKALTLSLISGGFGSIIFIETLDSASSVGDATFDSDGTVFILLSVLSVISVLVSFVGLFMVYNEDKMKSMFESNNGQKNNMK